MADSFKELVLESKEFASQKPFSFRRAAGDSDFGSFEVFGSPVFTHQCLTSWFHMVSPLVQVFLSLKKGGSPLFNGGKDAR